MTVPEAYEQCTSYKILPVIFYFCVWLIMNLLPSSVSFLLRWDLQFFITFTLKRSHQCADVQTYLMCMVSIIFVVEARWIFCKSWVEALVESDGLWCFLALEIRLYMMILEEQGKYEELLKLLQNDFRGML